jgi:hypothetical protein
MGDRVDVGMAFSVKYEMMPLATSAFLLLADMELSREDCHGDVIF